MTLVRQKTDQEGNAKLAFSGPAWVLFGLIQLAVGGGAAALVARPVAEQASSPEKIAQIHTMDAQILAALGSIEKRLDRADEVREAIRDQGYKAMMKANECCARVNALEREMASHDRKNQ